MRFTNKQQKIRAPRRRKSFVLPFLVVGLGLGACDIGSLLEVELPGQVTADALNNPALAETLVLSVQGDFECGLTDVIWYPGYWFDDILNTSADRPNALAGLRSEQINVYADPCGSTTGPVWTPLQTPRHQAQRAIELINGFEGTVPNKDFLIAKARLYEGYAIQLLGEMHCAVTFDGGPLMTREETWAEAEKRFTEVISLASNISGARAAEAGDILTAAYVGRARARLNLGNNPAGVVADAAKVPLDFEFVATYDESPSRRTNKLYTENHLANDHIPHVSYTNLTVSDDGRLTVSNGVPDPRVLISIPGRKEPRGILPLRLQMKYPNRSAAIPFATGREALLMIAEVEGGQTAVDAINTLRATHALPQFASTDPAEIEKTLQEERRRELWLQGTRPGDMLRWGTAFATADEFGQPLGPGGCLPVPLLEQTSNPNL